MHTPTYVYQNGFGVYYFRMAIPKNLRPVLRKREIRRSLKTTNHSYAIRKARKMAVLADELFLSGVKSRDNFEACFQAGLMEFLPNIERLPEYRGYRGILALEGDLAANTVTKESQPKSIQIKELISEYVKCQDVENTWQPKTKDENLAIFNVLVEIVGNVPLCDIDQKGKEKGDEGKRGQIYFCIAFVRYFAVEVSHATSSESNITEYTSSYNAART